ncbi:MAG: diguanylate cyclase [Candidatus Hydrogenedentes bacterium]|nr:diguanylate cyclase [Candidatus Hydrogenedentota bacterium]
MEEKILYLDSDAGIIELVQDFLQGESYVCEVASSSEEALTLLRKNKYTLFMTELYLESGSGIEVMKQAFALDHEMACIVTTGMMDVNDSVEVMRAGASDFLVKPFHLGDLAFTVEKTLERRRLLLENRRYQSSLEERIHEATAELEHTNKELRSTKEYLENLLNSSVDTVLTSNMNFQVTFVNRGVLDMLGYAPWELKDVPLANLFRGGKDEIATLYEKLKSGPVQNYETEMIHKAERHIPVMLSVSQVREQGGAEDSVLSICRDITQQKQLENELKELTITDGLTGLYNQRYFHERLQIEIERARRQDHPLSLLLFDVDRFKNYNDTKGHLEGDKVLKGIGDVVRESTRDYVDIACRYGGDEFTVILPETDQALAHIIAERIRTSFLARKFGSCTLSVGVMTYLQDSTPQSFIRFADEMMYGAKRLGGNCVVVYQPREKQTDIENKKTAGHATVRKSDEQGVPMKFGICSEIFKEWNDIERTINYVKEIGYDGLEIAPFTFSQYVYDIPASTRRDIVRYAEQAQLDILGIHWVFVGPEGVHLTHSDSAVRDFTRKYLEDLINFCGDVGGKVIIFGSPKQRNVARDLSYNQAFDFARELFEATMPLCEQRDVTICMEQLSHQETNFCQTPAETVELIEAVSHPNFQLLLDTKAMTFLPEDRPDVIRKYAKYLKHYHANDANLKGPGWGDVDFLPIFNALRDVKYDGYMSVEVFDFEAGPEAIAEKSLRYLKRSKNARRQ